jgi:hypothetical protein
MAKYQELLDKNANGTISETGQQQLAALRHEADRFCCAQPMPPPCSVGVAISFLL